MMSKILEIVSAIYYSGVGTVLLCTSIRFIYRLVREYDSDRTMLNEVREIHLPNIYDALQKIAKSLNIEIELETRP